MPVPTPPPRSSAAAPTEARKSQILEGVATGRPLAEVLQGIVELVEAQLPGSIASILLADPERHCLMFGAGHQLAEAYAPYAAGVPIGPAVGSCGTAAFRRQPVIVEDALTDPLWEGFRDFVRTTGVRAAWSFPLFGADVDGHAAPVIGTVAIYHREPALPEPAWLEVVADATHLARLALERVRSLRSLEETVARFRTLAEYTPDALFVHGERCLVLDVNQRACDSLGLSRDELIGMSPLAFDPDLTPAALEDIVRRLDRLESLHFESHHRRRDGTVFPVEIHLTPFMTGDQRRCVSVVRDISDRRRQETERQRREELARASQKMEAVGQLAGGIAHDFNNLLTVIAGHSELMLAQPPAPGASLDDVIAIRDAADSAARLTRQLLSFSRRAVVEPTRLDVNLVIESTARMLARLLGEPIALVLDLDRRLDHVHADAGQIEQLIVNLAVNARDAMPEGGTLTIATAGVARSEGAAATGALPPGRYVQVTVTDTGVGMSDEVRARIFEPFFTTKEQGRGTGLGLATVFGIVTQAGGTVAAAPAPGRGTTFTVLLPALPHLNQAAPRPAAPRTAARGTETILLAEDEAGLRLLAKRILESYGYQVIDGGFGAAAAAASEAHDGPIHMLLSDLVMPDLNGRELAERVRRTRPGIRVLFMSGYDEGVWNGTEPVHGFLQKPFTPRTLAAAVRSALDAAGPA